MRYIKRLLAWVRQNKLATVLLIILSYFLFKGSFSSFLGIAPFNSISRSRLPVEDKIGMPVPEGVAGPASKFGRGGIGGVIPLSREYTPQPDVVNRMVVRESHLSLLVNDVFSTMKIIIARVENEGGYMVESNVSSPSEAATGRLTLRIPESSLDTVLSFMRTKAVKVVSENLIGRDVSDEYIDIQARMATFNKTKEKFEAIMDEAVEISDILNIQQRLINLQDQIDNLKGRQQYLEQTARMSKVTVFLSTDELALPFAPSQPWRPEVVFKRAIRSLVGNLRKIGTAIIWIVVYSVVWIPIFGLYLFWKNRRKESTKKQVTDASASN